MNARVLKKVGSSVATEAAVGVTQEMVRIDSTNGKEDELARDLEGRLKSYGIGKVWCEKTYEGRLNTFWRWTAASPVRACFSPATSIPSRCAKAGCATLRRRHRERPAVRARRHGHEGRPRLTDRWDADAGRQRRRFRGKITFVGVADHMGQQTGSIDLFRRHTFDHCVLAELTDMQIYVAHRGRYYFDISTIGRSAHTCHKYHAINAIEKMLPVIGELSKLKYFPDIPQEMKDLVGPELFIAVGRIYGGCSPEAPR